VQNGGKVLNGEVVTVACNVTWPKKRIAPGFQGLGWGFFHSFLQNSKSNKGHLILDKWPFFSNVEFISNSKDWKD
jgi:hypothetical protein